MIKPTGTNVVIEPLEEKLSDTIVIPDGVREAPATGRVIAKGPKVPEELSIGDKVFCGRYEGIKVNRDGREMRILPFDTIMGILSA